MTTKTQSNAKAADTKGTEAKAADGKPTEQPAAAPAKTREELLAERLAPFANLPRLKIGDTENVLDMHDVKGNEAYKYAKVHEDARQDRLPVRRGWKHMAAVFVPGTNKGGENGFRPDSVYGTIADIVSRAGRSGISAQEVVTQVRQRQIGNKRSKYCLELPPVGWAEGWLDTSVTKNIINVHATKRAPALVTAPAGTEATPEQNKAAGADEAKAAA